MRFLPFLRSALAKVVVLGGEAEILVALVIAGGHAARLIRTLRVASGAEGLVGKDGLWLNLVCF